ncbi:caspase-9 isoform X2 [Balaenoptera acutorostrata]|uniref:Caspase-9 isoform X2 n=1 Tax=Balaenoptera acutorostrata TaxID=9767 RepID=A0ABM3S4R8_BALAC|nr:caspase-9 isoform X2 [Balaenoptera acutorostrata]
MDEADRRLLRRCRVRLVGELQVAALWDALLNRELFTPDMIEDIQRAGSGSRRDQARQLIIDLETRGSQALPLFISCLEDTGQDTLASLLRTSRQAAKQDPEAIRTLDLKPVVLGPVSLKPEELRVAKQDPSQPSQGKLAPVVLGPEELWPAKLRPEVLRPEAPRPVDVGSGGFSEIQQKDQGFEVASTSPEDRTPDSDPEPDATPFQEGPVTFDQPDAVSSLPTPSDILVSYSTFPGFVSWRDTKSGSWYIETLDSIFEQWAHCEDLQTLLLRVANAVSVKGIYKQIPGCFNFLRKKLFFKT